jgi:hypothetical protein
MRVRGPDEHTRKEGAVENVMVDLYYRKGGSGKTKQKGDRKEKARSRQWKGRLEQNLHGTSRAHRPVERKAVQKKRSCTRRCSHPIPLHCRGFLFFPIKGCGG